MSKCHTRNCLEEGMFKIDEGDWHGGPTVTG